jgi:hypothetical protein
MELVGLIGFGLLVFYFIVLPILVITARRRVTRLEAEVGVLHRELASVRTGPSPSEAAAATESRVAQAQAPTPAPTTATERAPAAPPPREAPAAARERVLPPSGVALPPATASERAPAAPPRPEVAQAPAEGGLPPTAVPPAAAGERAPGAPPVPPRPEVAPAPAEGGLPPTAVPPAAAGERAPGALPVPPRPEVARPPTGMPPREPAAGVGAASAGAAAGAGAPPRGTWPPPPPVTPPPPAPPSGGGGGWGGLASFNWESLVGVKLFSAIAGIALLLAMVFFLRFSLDRGWLQPPVRVAIGVIVGIALLVVCELRAANRYRVTANALDASAIAILFSTFFAAHALWELIPAGLTFVLLVIVTAVAVLLSVRRGSLFIAVLGLLGGFAAPALLSSGQKNPIGLFGYLLLLNAGLAWVAHTKRWPVITKLTLVLTFIYQWGWVLKFLDAASLPLAAGIFLIFPLLSMFIATLSERYGGGSSPKPDTPGTPAARAFGDTPALSAVLPLLLATYIAAVPQYGARYGVLFGFLFCIDIGLFFVSALRRAAVLHIVGGATTLMVFAVWFGLSYGSVAWPVVLAILSAFALLYLLMPIVADRIHRPLEGAAARAVFTAPLLLAAFPVLVVMEPATAQPLLLFGVLALLLIAMAAFAIGRRQGAVYFTAAFFAIVTEIFWSGNYLTPGRLYSALMVYFTFALISIAVPAVARRFNRELQPRAAGAILVLASFLLAFFLVGPGVARASLWGLAGLIGLVLAALALEARTSKAPWLAPVGAGVAWILLWGWWGSAHAVTMVLPALVVVTGVSLLMMATAIWLRPHVLTPGSNASDGVSGNAEPAFANLALGLIGHLFLFALATNTAFTTPPWPIFGVLLVLDLAIAVAALHQRRGELHVAGIAASAIVLFTWSLWIDTVSWDLVAIVVALALPAYAFATMRLASRVAFVKHAFLVGIAVAAVGGQLIMTSAAGGGVAPALALLILPNVVLLVTLLALAARERWSRMVWVPLVTSTLVLLAWRISPALTGSWRAQLALPAAVYACFLAYPLVLGRRVGGGIEPHRAAVLAGVPFFFFARKALLDGGFAPVIGALPVVQGILMLVLLVRLLRLEPPGARTLGRLALVAGAALAFVTIAIPLQLDKQWLTVGWALEGAALAWLYRRIPHRGLLLACSGLLAVVFVRLALNPGVFVYAPRSSTRIWNWYLYTYLISAAACFIAARLLARTEDRLLPSLPRVSAVLPGIGAVLLFLLLNIEISDYYSTGPTLTFRFSATLAQDLTYTLGWGLFALGLLVVGIRGRIRLARMASIGLLLITVLKCFLHDLGRLGGLYLVASFVGLAVCLALVALALQRFALAEPKDAV